MNKKIGLSFLGCTTLFTPFFTIACNLASQRNTIIVQLAQGEFWPLAFGLKPLTEYYNNNFKDQQDFVKVELQFKDKTRTDDEFKLIKKVKDYIITGDFNNLPNIVVGSQSGAYVLKQTNNLLDLSGSIIKKDLFSKKIANLHSTLAGQGEKTETLFNIPFDNSDLDSLNFNYQLLNKMFDLIKKNGGTINESANIVKSVEQAAKKANEGNKDYTKIPENSVWNWIKAKNKTVFKDIRNVDDSTFESIQSIRDLAKKFTQGLEIDNPMIATEIISGNVFSIDYFYDTFYKELDSRIDKDKVIFKLNSKNDVDYNLVTDSSVEKETKNLWDDYTINVKQRIEQETKKGAVSKKVVFQSIKYTDRDNDWGAHEIRRFQSAISLTPSVGSSQNKITNWVANPDDRKDAKSGDVAMKPQLLLSKSKGQKIFSEGGSSILPIDSKNSRLNQGTIKFLEWLYTGKNKLDQQNEEENWITLAKNSGYIMPLAKVVNDKKGLNKLEERYKNLQNKLNAQTDKTKSNEYITLNLLESAILSLKSILDFETNGEIIAKPTVQDDKTAEIRELLKNELQNSTKIDSPTTAMTSDELIKRIKKIVKQH
ncbi:P68 family surface lipoprotein [Mycoplasma putrefaciens]|uniref:Lipoprotein n=1 Tax=Mycoplasma putrefaciens Mput9231 TaxID=1292033 RepID=M9WGJ8_9MOLU|nr:hypothetical protein [Mycoplasma putrefaciens]AGJ90570.1 Hypothetical protein, predicted lipoprotein [Mycoplasma putrefaciens Mput9231]